MSTNIVRHSSEVLRIQAPHRVYNSDYTGIPQTHPIAYCTRTTFMLYSHHDRNGRRRNDGRRASAILEGPGMEPSHKKEQRERVFLCQKMEAFRCLHWPRLKGRRGNRGTYPETVSKSPIKIASAGWHMNKFTAVRILSSVLQTPDKIPRVNLPTFSIHRLLSHGKILCSKRWAHGRRCAHE